MTSTNNGNGINNDYSRIVAAVDRVFQRRYRVYRTSIGEGGMGTVFRVETNDAFRMKRALKILYKRDQRPGMNIYAEVNAVKGMDHPGIPQVIEVGEDNEAVYIIQELVEGQSLRQVIERNGQVSDETLILWMGDVADALSYLHQRNIIHRDIKPTNIMITSEGRIKLIDFGLAKEMEEVDTADNRVIGTKNYTPPERYEGLPADVRTDIYEFGTTFYNLATGQAPLEMSSDSRRHMVTMRRNLDNVKSPGIRSILKKCIDVNPDRRYQNFDEIRYRIKTIDEFNKSIVANERRHKALKSATAVVLALGVLVLGAGIWQSVNDHDNYYEELISKAADNIEDGKYEKARDFSEEAIQFNSGRHMGYQRKYEAMTKEAEGKIEKATKDYEDIVAEIIDDSTDNEELREDGNVQFMKGNAYFEMGEAKDAEDALTSAIEELKEEKQTKNIKTTIREARVVQALNYIKQGKNKDAGKVMVELKDDKTETPETDYINGYIKKNEGDAGKAEEYFNKVINNVDANLDLRRKAASELADMYIKTTKEYAKAVRLIKGLQTKEPSLENDWKMNAMLGDSAFYSKEYELVIATARKMQKLGDTSFYNADLIYRSYYELKQYNEAKKVAEEMIGSKYHMGYVLRTNAIYAENTQKETFNNLYERTGEYERSYQKACQVAESNNGEMDDRYQKMKQEHEMVEQNRIKKGM